MELALETEENGSSPCVEALEGLDNFWQPAPRIEVRSIQTIDELRQLHQIDADAYQECSISFDLFQLWWEQYPDGNTVVFSDGQIIASLGLYPISEHQSDGFINGEIRESDLIPVSIEECEACPQRFWYASGIVLKSHLRGTVENNPIIVMVKTALWRWFESQRVDYPLRVLALSEYNEGENILKRFRFVKLRDQDSVLDKCDLYSAQFQEEEEIEEILKIRHLWN